MSGNARQKYQLLIDKIFSATRDGRLEWNNDIIDETTVFTTIGSKIVELSDGRSSNAEPIIVVNIRDADGKSLDSFNDENLNGLTPPSGEFPSYWSLLNELISIARRQSTGADKAIDEILQELDDRSIF